MNKEYCCGCVMERIMASVEPQYRGWSHPTRGAAISSMSELGFVRAGSSEAAGLVFFPPLTSCSPVPGVCCPSMGTFDLPCCLLYRLANFHPSLSLFSCFYLWSS